jgi:hypothetical protein
VVEYLRGLTQQAYLWIDRMDNEQLRHGSVARSDGCCVRVA